MVASLASTRFPFPGRGVSPRRGLLPTSSSGLGSVTHEEHHTHGSTAWWAEKRGIQVSRKRYRYTGQEKDEETGLCYHHHRYYMPWLGRWASADPAGLVDGGNRYGCGQGNPLGGRDPSGLFGEMGDATGAGFGPGQRSLSPAQRVYLEARKNLTDHGMPTQFVDAAWRKNYVFMKSDPSAPSSTYYLNKHPTGWLDLPIVGLSPTPTDFIHEAVHDDLQRNFHTAPVRIEFKREAQQIIGTELTNGATATREMAPRLVNESFGYWVGGQVEALAFIDELDVGGIVDDYLRGDLRQQELVDSLSVAADWTARLLHQRGEDLQSGTLSSELSSRAKQFAAERYLGGNYYDSFEDIPAVKSQLDRVDFDVVNALREAQE